ncbi:MAG: N-acetylmuramoyl-L-alanine amidase, partial [Aeromonas sp.]
MRQQLTLAKLRKGRVTKSGCWRFLFALLGLLGLLLNGCTPAEPPLSTRYQSASHNPRIAFLILHYTDEDDANSLRLLTEP